jgi:NAD(P) transhydrogenase subunit beta
MSENILTVAYIVASAFFILSLSGLSNPETARRGNIYGIIGMSIAFLATALLSPKVSNYGILITVIIPGVVIGAVLAARVAMTSMPELVAILHSFVGLAAVFVGIGSFLQHQTFNTTAEKTIHDIEIFVGVFIGAITFTGSIVAFGKLRAIISSKPLTLPARHFLNLIMLLVCVFLGYQFVTSENGLQPLLIMTGIAFVLGIHLVAAIGGGDMPVVVSMLNSYSGWAAAAAGFMLSNDLLIVTGALVGSSGAILSAIMCKAMNRSFISVILGGFGAEEGAAAADTGQKSVRSGSPEDAAFIMENAETVIIVPGYGLAVARAQHAVKELAMKLISKGVTVKYAIHPVAGRMPGHMNVLLAEAEVPYDQVFEMEDINGEFGTADVALILGANDVVNPLAEEKGSPIYGMPILEAYKAKTVIVNKRSMASGYAGLDNPLFYMDKTMMVFGDAKKVVEELVKDV